MALDTREPSTDGRPRGFPGLGLVKGLMITLKHMLRPSVTQQYPDEKPDLPPRTRGVIASIRSRATFAQWATESGTLIWLTTRPSSRLSSTQRRYAG